jgi:hypothetical protein
MMPKAVAGFEWDEGNLEKCQKHGASIGEIEALLNSDPRVAEALRGGGQIHRGRQDRGRPAAVRGLHVPDEEWQTVRPPR